MHNEHRGAGGWCRVLRQRRAGEAEQWSRKPKIIMQKRPSAMKARNTISSSHTHSSKTRWHFAFVAQMNSGTCTAGARIIRDSAAIHAVTPTPDGAARLLLHTHPSSPGRTGQLTGRAPSPSLSIASAYIQTGRRASRSLPVPRPAGEWKYAPGTMSVSEVEHFPAMSSAPRMDAIYASVRWSGEIHATTREANAAQSGIVMHSKKSIHSSRTRLAHLSRIRDCQIDVVGSVWYCRPGGCYRTSIPSPRRCLLHRAMRPQRQRRRGGSREMTAHKHHRSP